MSKSIIVIDTPTRCGECRFARLYNTILSRDLIMCTAVKNDLFVWRDDKPKWCPLRPLPQKVHTVNINGIECGLGWNTCIDEITGETE